MTRIVILLVLSMAMVGGAVAQPENDFSTKTLVLKTTRYVLDLRVDYDAGKLFGTCRITVANSADHETDHVPLLLYRLLKVTSVQDDAGHAVPFTQRVQSFDNWEEMQASYIEIRPEQGMVSGRETTFTIVYEGYLHGYTETGMLYVQDRIDPAFTLIRPDSWGFPWVGYPSWRVNRAAGLQSFDYRVSATVPDSLVVANGGRLVDKQANDGLVTYIYENIKPAWRIDVAIAPYKVLEREGTRIFYFPEDAEGATRVMESMTKGLNLYTDWFGPLRAYQGYSLLEIPEGWGSQADVTSILQTADAFKNQDEHRQLYHELSHLWNANENDSLPPRWNEGLASFLQYMTVEELEHRSVVQDAIMRTRTRLVKQLQEQPHYASIPYVEYGKEGITGLSYSMGLIAFAVLYDLVGREQFNALIGSFYQTYATSGATMDEFATHATHNATIDLTPFFDDWFYGTKNWTYIRNGTPIEHIVQTYRER